MAAAASRPPPAHADPEDPRGCHARHPSPPCSSGRRRSRILSCSARRGLQLQPPEDDGRIPSSETARDHPPADTRRSRPELRTLPMTDAGGRSCARIPHGDRPTSGTERPQLNRDRRMRTLDEPERKRSEGGHPSIQVACQGTHRWHEARRSWTQVVFIAWLDLTAKNIRPVSRRC